MKSLFTSILLAICSLSVYAVDKEQQGCLWTASKATCFWQLPRDAQPAQCTVSVRGYLNQTAYVEKSKTFDMVPGKIAVVDVEGQKIISAAVKAECK